MRCPFRFGLAVAIVAGVSRALSAAEPFLIRHDALDCLPRDHFAQISASIEPQEQARLARVYFRAESSPHFYFVEMASQDGRSVTYLPKPGRETRRVVYYLEATNIAQEASRSEEYTVDVLESADCRQKSPDAGWLVGENPGLVVGATADGAPPLPPGFRADGVVGFLSATGTYSSRHGGPGRRTAAGAALGAVLGVGALVRGGEEEEAGGPVGPEESPRSSSSTVPRTTTTVRSPATTTAPSTTVPTTSIASSTSTINPPPPTTSSPTTSTTPTTTVPTTTVSTTVPTTTTAPTTTTSVPSSTTTSTVPTTSTTSTTTTSTPAPALVACFKVEDADGPAGCAVRFDASCSQGNPVSYSWNFDDGVEVTEIVPITVYDWTRHPACGSNFKREVELTVRNAEGDEDETEQLISPTNPSGLQSLEHRAPELEVSFTSSLSGSSGDVLEGRVLSSPSRADPTNGLAPFQHSVRAPAGPMTIEAVVTRGGTGEAFWRFEFGASAHFVPGSIEVETGVPSFVDAQSITFRLSGAPGERVRFRIRVADRLGGPLREK